MKLSASDTEVLRRLGAEYMSFAVLPIQKRKMELWKALNRSEMQRPMVNIDQIPFGELRDAHPEELTCVVENSYFRCLEDSLRRQIYQWKHFPADMVLEPFIRLPSAVHLTDYGLQPIVTRKRVEGTSGADSQIYTATVTALSDVEKLLDRHVFYDAAFEEEAFETAKDVFAGIADVRKNHGLTFHLGIWDQLEQFLGGPETSMYLFYDEPELLHAAMRRMTDATLTAIDEANKLRVVNDVAETVHCSYVFDDHSLPDFDAGKGSTSDHSWAFGLAQIFHSISPEFMAKFELPYITELASKFENIYYGCCDRLDDRLDTVVRKIPHVRKVSCSPWSDRRSFAEQIGKKLIMSNKPTPAYLANFDEDAIRKDLSYTVSLAKENGVNLELILKDISTICHKPERLDAWNRIAMEVVENY